MDNEYYNIVFIFCTKYSWPDVAAVDPSVKFLVFMKGYGQLHMLLLGSKDIQPFKLKKKKKKKNQAIEPRWVIVFFSPFEQLYFYFRDY